MFEAKIIELLSEDSDITETISRYNGVPSIFTDQAPEDAPFPYIVFTIRSISPPDSIIDRFMIEIDYFNTTETGKNARVAVDNIQEYLDNKTVSNERYNSIRIRRDIYNPVPESDPRGIHYNIQLEARATRKKWMSTIL